MKNNGSLIICALAASGVIWVAGSILAYASIKNGDFETGTFNGWKADVNWVVSNDSKIHYSGWEGKYWAWSGGTGEASTGTLVSDLFILDKEAISFLITGWSSIQGSGKPRKWNYVTVSLEKGEEIARVYAPNTTKFVRVFLDVRQHKGKKAFLKAVDDADEDTYSMLGIDDVRTVDLPADLKVTAKYRPVFDRKNLIVLEDSEYRVDFDRKTGSLLRLYCKKPKLDLILEPRLAGSFRFALPIPGKEPWQTIEANWIFGKDQTLTNYKIIAGKKLELFWEGPLKNYLGEDFLVSATETVELVDGGVLFQLEIANQTNFPVGEVYFPVIGGIIGLGSKKMDLKNTLLLRPQANGEFTEAEIFKTFLNMSPFGDQGPEQYYAYPQNQPESWIALYQPKNHSYVYFGTRDPEKRNVVFRLVLEPASSGTIRDDGNWPREEELEGIPCGVEASIVEFASSLIKSKYTTAPVLIKYGEGKPSDISHWHKDNLILR